MSGAVSPNSGGEGSTDALRRVKLAEKDAEDRLVAARQSSEERLRRLRDESEAAVRAAQSEAEGRRAQAVSLAQARATAEADGIEQDGARSAAEVAAQGSRLSTAQRTSLLQAVLAPFQSE
ncbi:MAG: hypothetical protein L3J95_03865 [Thermoplasmata archaeon]|nr:hypothetical protein [Thermoplasmata archaeon]MCI4359544.1 hypothetical protein [Thermoplasmata archaeon]